MKQSLLRAVAPLVCVLALGLVQESAAHSTHIREEQGHQQEHGHLRVTESGEKPHNSKNNNPFGGVILGFLLWWLVPVCLWNNERIAIKQYKMQLKAERYAVHIDDPSRDPLEELDGRIAYVTGTSEVNETLADDMFTDVKSDGKIKLHRIVEMYQWQEIKHEEEDDGKTRTYYTYEKKWMDVYSEVHHDSEKKNPAMRMESTKRGNNYRASTAVFDGNGEDCPEAKHANVKVGAYYLGEYVIRELQNWQPKELSPEALKKKTLSSGKNHGFMKGEAELDSDGWYYFGSKTELGDARVRFEELCPGPLTIVGVLSKTGSGWTFVPIMRADAKGKGDSLCAEWGGSCCFRVKELHYTPADEDGDDELKEHLEKLETELTKKEKASFHRSQTTAEVKSYNPEDDIDDLCCVGPCGGLVIRFMHWIGLEEEFLGVSENEEELDTMMSREGKEAATRHHQMRIAGWILLILGSYLIIAPIIRMLNFHWMATLLGGGLISLVLICMACACSTGAFCCIVSVSWIAHRPFLATVGILMCVLTFAGLYTFIYTEEHKAQSAPSLLHLHFHHYSASFLQAMTQSLGSSALH